MKASQMEWDEPCRKTFNTTKESIKNTLAPQPLKEDLSSLLYQTIKTTMGVTLAQ